MTVILIGTYATKREAMQHAKWLRAKGRNAYARKANKGGEYAVWEKV
jgi:hypothetical protein